MQSRGKKNAFNASQWLQVRDVTDSWPIIVRRFGVLDPLKHSAAKGISNKPGTRRERNVMIAFQWHWYNTVTTPGDGETLCAVTGPRLTTAALSSRHFINLSERAYGAALSPIATSPYTHAAAYMFDLH